MNINGVNFNVDFWTGKTLAAFKKQEGHHGFSDDQLEEAFFLINPGAKATVNGNDKPGPAKGKKDEHSESD